MDCRLTVDVVTGAVMIWAIIMVDNSSIITAIERPIPRALRNPPLHPFIDTHETMVEVHLEYKRMPLGARIELHQSATECLHELTNPDK